MIRNPVGSCFWKSITTLQQSFWLVCILLGPGDHLDSASSLFLSKETDDQRCEVICPGSHSEY